MPIGRRDVDNAATALSGHRAQFVLHAQEYAHNVGVVDGLEVFDGAVLNRAGLAFKAGGVDGNVETAKSRDCLVDKVADLVFLRNVSPNEFCFGPKRFQLSDKGLAFVVVAAGHDHIGAFARECHGSGATDAGEGAGNENNLLSHLFPSAMRRALTVATVDRGHLIPTCMAEWCGWWFVAAQPREGSRLVSSVTRYAGLKTLGRNHPQGHRRRDQGRVRCAGRRHSTEKQVVDYSREP